MNPFSPTSLLHSACFALHVLHCRPWMIGVLDLSQLQPHLDSKLGRPHTSAQERALGRERGAHHGPPATAQCAGWGLKFGKSTREFTDSSLRALGQWDLVLGSASAGEVLGFDWQQRQQQRPCPQIEMLARQDTSMLRPGLSSLEAYLWNCSEPVHEISLANNDITVEAKQAALAPWFCVAVVKC